MASVAFCWPAVEPVQPDMRSRCGGEVRVADVKGRGPVEDVAMMTASRGVSSSHCAGSGSAREDLEESVIAENGLEVGWDVEAELDQVERQEEGQDAYLPWEQ